MIRTLLFDFGYVFINLDRKGAMQNALHLFQMEEFEDDMIAANIQYEIGQITTSEFIEFYLSKFPNLNATQIIDAWNYILKDFPKYRLDFIKNLADQKRYNLMLLSNTNDMHIAFIKTMDIEFYENFKACFDKFYLSHEIHLRKPDEEVFEFVLQENHLNPNECLFIDDTKVNILAAEAMGIHTWHIDETKDDVIYLFETKKCCFDIS